MEPIFEIREFAQVGKDGRFTVKKFTEHREPIEGCDLMIEPPPISFLQGLAVIGIPTKNPEMPFMPKEVEFRFPAAITSVVTAFEKFKEVLEDEVMKMFQEEERLQKEKSKKIVTPESMAQEMAFNPNFRR
jgi:hypothetical protein